MTTSALPLRRPPAGGLLAQRIGTVVCLLIPLAGLLLFFLYPLGVIAVHSLRDMDGHFTLANYTRLWRDPGVPLAAWHSLLLALATTALAVVGGLGVAMGLYRSRLAGKPLIRATLLLPLLAPSLMQGLGVIFLFGRNGLIHRLTGLHTDIYGFTGLLLANTCYALPQVVIILSSALARVDHRYYDAAETMGASPWRRFTDITLPQARFGLLAAALLVFTLTLTDFGNAIVVGGDYHLLATAIYDQVNGQMDFGMGASIGIVLLLPTVLSVLLERFALRHQAGGSEHAVAPRVSRQRSRDIGLGLLCVMVLLPLLANFLVVVYASVIKLWPYNLSLTLTHYHTDLPDGYTPILTSLKIALAVATSGTVLIFLLALTMRQLPPPLARAIHLLATLPAAVPGLIVGIGYVLTFNDGTLGSWLYGSATIVALCGIYHYHAQGYLTMRTGLRSIPSALEDAARCLGANGLHTLRDVVLPFVAPTLVSVFFYLFMQAMVTLSAVVFLITPDLNLASVSVMQLNENGFVSQAAAYSTCIVIVVALAMAAMRLALNWLGRQLQARRLAHVA